MTTNEDLKAMQRRLDDVQADIDDARGAAERDGVIAPEEPEPTFFDPDPHHHEMEGSDRAIAPPG
jgi:hypothetical protein